MTKAREHLVKYPHARSTTIRYLEARDEMTARLRKELGMDEVTDKLARLVEACEPKETVLQRLIRKLRRV